MPMFFLDRRAKVICDELKKEAVRQKCLIQSWQYKEGFYVNPAEADAAPIPYAPFDSEAMRWYGPDRHWWFTAECVVPDSFQDRPLYLLIRTQIDDWDDGRNPQFLLFVDGEVVQGIDMNHREVLITSHAKAGTRYRLDLQSYTGTLHAEFRLLVDMMEIDPDIQGLYWDLTVPLQAFSRLEEGGADPGESRPFLCHGPQAHGRVPGLSLHVQSAPAVCFSERALS